jgi:hypothetical protein
MIHVAEDAFEDEWPILGWYRTRRYRLIDGDKSEIVTVRARRHEWSIFYAERAFSRDLVSDSISRYEDVDGIGLWYCESEKLVNHLRSKHHTGYPYRFAYFPYSLLFPTVKRKLK